MTAREDIREQSAFFEALHSSQNEPWSFSVRGAELLRHEWILATVKALAPSRILDIGCSMGQLTARLATLPAELLAMDVSPTAVNVARRRLRAGGAFFVAAGATDLPVARRSVDVVVASDGIYSWNLARERRQTVLAELRRVVRSGGHVLLTEHTRPNRFPEFVAEIEQSGLQVVRITYLYDRPWYQFESWFKAVQHWRVVGALRRDVTLARIFQRIGRLGGPRASRHICVLAKDAT